MPGKKSILIILFLVLSALSLYVAFRKNESSRKEPQLSYRTHVNENGWGYSIFTADTVLLIKQDFIPGLAGTQGFESEPKAAKTADYVISKIRKGVFPPTLSPGELDSLGVL